MSADELPSDVDALRRLVLEASVKLAEQQAELITCAGLLTQRDELIAKLEREVHVLSKWKFGRRSEKRSAPDAHGTNQTWLPFAELLDAAQRVADRCDAQGQVEIHVPTGEVPKPTPTRRAKRRSEFPAHLPRVRTTFELPEDVRVCCAKPMEPMGVELSRELERFEIAVVHELARTKYCCRTCQMAVLTAPGPTRALEKSLLGSNWLAQLLVERFGHHMPYYRLEQKYASEGLSLSRTVLCRSAIALSERFEGVYEALGDEVTGADVCFADETSAKVQDSKAGGPRKVWVWLYANKDGDCFFDYNESRGRDSPTRRLAQFKGALHDDGYCVYESALDPTRVVHVACWAHARRYFCDAEKNEPQLVGEALDWIGKLYALDRSAKERGLSTDEVAALRREHAPAILAGFKEWLDLRRTQVRPTSGVGEAIDYVLGRWQALGRFVEDGRYELDNNRAERALRCIAVGRKNWIQFGNERGGRAGAVFFSLIQTCKERGIEPKLYLHDVMLRLAEGVNPKQLTPREWQARFSAEVHERRSYVLGEIAAKLA
jgi:transposase